MKMLNLKPADVALLPEALDMLLKRLMVGRVSLSPHERAMATQRIDRAVTLKRRLANTDEDQGAVVVFDGGRFPDFPGLDELDRATSELFGLGSEPAIIKDAIAKHRATIAVAMMAASVIGGHSVTLRKAAKALLDAFGGDTPHFVRPEAIALEEAAEALQSAGDGDLSDEEIVDALKRIEVEQPHIAKVLRSMPGFPYNDAPAEDDEDVRVADHKGA